MNVDRFKNWRRFSLRTLFILMTVCCLIFGAWAVYVNPYRHQQRSLAVVNRLQGNTVKAPAEGPAWNGWLVTTLLGKDAFVQVTEVELNGKEVTDEELGRLAGLVYLRKLALDYTPVTDSGLATLHSMPNLQDVSLRYTKVSDSGAEHLGQLQALRSAHLTGTKITDAGVDHLAKRPEMAELYIRWTGITNTGADRLAAALPNCAVYHHALTP